MAARRRARMPDPATVERPWIDAYPPGVPPDHAIPPVPLTRLLDDAVRDFPASTAVRFAGTSISWHDVGERVQQAARILAAAGVAAGDRVGVLLPNVPAAVVALFAIWRLGAVAVPVDPGDDDDELDRMLTLAGVGILVGRVEDHDRLQALADRRVEPLALVVSDVTAWLSRAARVRWALRHRGTLRSWRPSLRRGAHPSADLPHFEDASSDEVLPRLAVAADQTAAVLFTSGATGRRKGVMLSHHNLVANAFQARLWVPDTRTGHERILCALPFAHAYGLTTGLLVSTLAAATMVLPDSGHAGGQDRTGRLLDLIDREQPTLLAGVPALFDAIASHPSVRKHDLSSLRACVSGAAPLPAEVAAAFEDCSSGARVREGYGLTEAGPLTHANPIYGRVVDATIGVPVTGTVAIVVDPADPTRRCAVGEVGELAVHGPQVMQGLLGEPSREPLRDGWLLTGDLVTADADGVFRWVGRTSEVVDDGGRGWLSPADTTSGRREEQEAGA